MTIKQTKPIPRYAKTIKEFIDRMVDLGLPVEEQILLIDRLINPKTSFPLACIRIDEILEEVRDVKKKEKEKTAQAAFTS